MKATTSFALERASSWGGASGFGRKTGGKATVGHSEPTPGVTVTTGNATTLWP